MNMDTWKVNYQFAKVTNNDNDLILQQQSLENTMNIFTSTQVAITNINDLENSNGQWKQKDELNFEVKCR
ncbi:hypothetical protein C1646_765643 [Rhizophagus diaphanus]|nr:hypothetical protein C1646_765643 [Rhizophagus diaphanus] [Rhizophagus sp. MUCL 43196]